MSYFTPQQINQFFPVIGIIKFKGGVVVRRSCLLTLGQARYIHKRREIFMVSKRSLAKLALLVRGCGVEFRSLMTLTYGANYPLSGKMAKKDLNHFLISAKRNFGPFEYVWVLEFQERGAVHFHIACTLPEPGILERSIFAGIWQKICTPHFWPYSQLEIVESRYEFRQVLETGQAVFLQHIKDSHWEKVKKGDSLHHYFAKYSLKIRQKKVPDYYRDVGRFWGASSGVRLPDGEYFHGSDEHVRQLTGLYGRDMSHMEVLPKVLLLG